MEKRNYVASVLLAFGLGAGGCGVGSSFVERDLGGGVESSAREEPTGTFYSFNLDRNSKRGVDRENNRVGYDVTIGTNGESSFELYEKKE